MILFSKENKTGIIKLNNPEKRNALHPELVKQFKEALSSAVTDDEIKVLIITGEGKSFCAGADLAYLSELQKYNSIENEVDSENLADLFLQVYRFPKPVIAAVNGAAIAGGCGLASVCDLIVADENNAKFGYTEVKIGFVPAIVSVFLLKRVGEGIAKQLFLTGELMNSKRAYEIGFVNYLTDDCLNKAKELAETLQKNSSFSMELIKSMIQKISGFNAEAAVDFCTRLNVISRSSVDFKKGLTNFLKKI